MIPCPLLCHFCSWVHFSKDLYVPKTVYSAVLFDRFTDLICNVKSSQVSTLHIILLLYVDTAVYQADIICTSMTRKWLLSNPEFMGIERSNIVCEWDDSYFNIHIQFILVTTSWEFSVVINSIIRTQRYQYCELQTLDEEGAHGINILV